ncbi:hypothetical protein K474DRAFT_1714243 [Panus rudis PR-1116 ss-1]|nr:hypothetical protein K474DRAFT_1714243 [Panus rudis PR-1116 ss-1]
MRPRERRVQAKPASGIETRDVQKRHLRYTSAVPTMLQLRGRPRTFTGVRTLAVIVAIVGVLILVRQMRISPWRWTIGMMPQFAGAFAPSGSLGPNLASHQEGASVIPALTGTHRSVLTSYLPFLSNGPAAVDLQCGSPDHMLSTAHPVDGRCWSFPGAQGHIGIVLERPARIRNISIGHVLSPLTAGSAPKEGVVWGLVDGAENKERFTQLGPLLRHIRDGFPLAIPGESATNTYVLLAEFFYDANANHSVQTYATFDAFELGMDFGIVVFQIYSNWGYPYTNVYHLGLFGDLVDL